ncbi:MAG: diguanylate cyclase [Dyella sp.]
MNSIQPKILIVDDMPANLVAMRRLLSGSGAQLLEASSGNEALALCLDHHFALILLDVNMPDMDGFEVAALLGEAEQLRETPIIFVTAAYADDLNRLKGYRFGAVDYIAKPINDVILQSKVRIFLELYSARAHLQIALDELSLRNDQLTLEIAERQRIEAQVRHQATHDMLTGLPNRTLFHERLQAAITGAPQHGTPFALAYVDIDGFKAVNDTHGHPIGDLLLQHIAGRLRMALRPADTVARLGGDEFALIVENTADRDALHLRCQQLVDELAQPYALQWGAHSLTVSVSASVGVALWPTAHGGDNDDEALIHRADNALYQAKRAGKNRCVMAAAPITA